MKKRIGWLNNKPIIQGDKNLKNSNELHIDELSSNNSGGGEGSGTSKVHYYRIDNKALINEFESLGYGEDMIVGNINLYCMFANSYIYADEEAIGTKYIGVSPVVESLWVAHRVKGLLVSEDIYYGNYPYIIKGDFYTKINYIIKMLMVENPEEAESVKSVFDICLKYTTEITENEFFGMCDLPITPLPE